MKQTLLTALNNLPEPLQKPLQPILANPQFNGVITSDTVDELQLHSKLETPELLLSLLPLAAAYSIAPISNFYVGAIARGFSGNLYFGANYEFLNHTLFNSIHAEQASINNAMSHQENGIIDVTVTASPCGHCRQFMNELHCAEQLAINLATGFEDGGTRRLTEILPDAFGPQDLGITDSLLKAPNQDLALESEDPLAQAALTAANSSYAPYSHCYAGIAITTTDNQIVAGRYVENAAFNPSLPPLQSALINLNLHGYKTSDIARVMLVEKADTLISHSANSRILLSEISNAELEILTV